MLADWFYSHPAWMAGTLGIVTSVLLACGGVHGTSRLVSVQARREHNDVIGFTLAIVGVVYAVLLAFIAVVTWETFSKAGEVVDNEVSHLANLYSDTSVLHGDTMPKFRDQLKEYTRVVIEEEWPAQQAGHSSRQVYEKGWEILQQANELLLSVKPADVGDADVHRAAISEINDLLAARRVRVDAAAGHVPAMVWWIIILGGALTVAYTFLFGMPSFAMHLLTTAGVAASLALVVLLIAELDYPFRGDISVSDEPFVRVHHEMSARQPP